MEKQAEFAGAKLDDFLKLDDEVMQRSWKGALQALRRAGLDPEALILRAAHNIETLGKGPPATPSSGPAPEIVRFDLDDRTVTFRYTHEHEVRAVVLAGPTKGSAR